MVTNSKICAKLRYLWLWLFISIGLIGCDSRGGSLDGLNGFYIDYPNLGIVLSANDFEYDKSFSRTSFDVSSSGIKFSWAADDTIGIFPSSGGQLYFPIQDGYGAQIARFDGGGWALRSNFTYSAYYPFKEGIHFLNKSVPIDFSNQIQIGKNSTSHLSRYDYMSARATAPSKGVVMFNFEHLSSLVELTLPLSIGSRLNAVHLIADEPIFNVFGTVDITSPTPHIKSNIKLKKISLKLKDFVVDSIHELAKVYLMVPPVDFKDKTIQVVLEGNFGIYHGLLEHKTLVAGKAYNFNLNLSDTWIDLGLSVLWSSQNLGALVPEDTGEYYAWGELHKKSIYSEENSMTFAKTMPDFSGDPHYDVATYLLGSPARMATNKEWEELLANCVSSWTTINGVNGRLLTSKINNKSIFLPALGYRFRSDLVNSGDFGTYWSSTPYTPDINAYHAFRLGFNKDGIKMNWGNRSSGRLIRPVRERLLKTSINN